MVSGDVEMMRDSAMRRMAEDGFDAEEIAEVWGVSVEEAREVLEDEPEEGFCPLCDGRVEFGDSAFDVEVFRQVMRFVDVYQLNRVAALEFLDGRHPGFGEGKSREEWEQVAQVLLMNEG